MLGNIPTAKIPVAKGTKELCVPKLFQCEMSPIGQSKNLLHNTSHK
jgi:hypothetical protein